jgi:hypothetical protein
MRRRVTRAFALVVMACATAFTAITPAAAHDLDTDRFQVKVRGGNGHYEDVGRDGPSIGDYTVFRERVYHRGNRVGRNNGHCDVTRAGIGRFASSATSLCSCVVEARLRCKDCSPTADAVRG